MGERIPIPKSIRFEVFKRDKFTCQYCGNSAPEVVLHVDHIQPIAKGGDNDITNLITACADCNSGKGARELSDDAVIQKRKKQLDELQERREQIEMMSVWQSELLAIEEAEVESVVRILSNMMPGWTYSESGKAELRNLIKRYSAAEVINAGKIVRDQYVTLDELGNATEESSHKFVTLLPSVCRDQVRFNHNRYLFQFNYIKGILRNRLGVILDAKDILMLCKVTDSGVNVDDLIDHAKFVKNYLVWRRDIRGMIAEELNG